MNGSPVSAVYSDFDTVMPDCILPLRVGVAMRRYLDYGTCNPKAKVALFIGGTLNGTIVHKHIGLKGDGRMASIYASGYYLPHTIVTGVSPFLLERYKVLVYYCEYDKDRIHNNVNWMDAYDLTTWLLVLDVFVARRSFMPFTLTPGLF